MPDYKKLAKGLNSAIRAAEAEASAARKVKGTQDVLPAAEREANLARFREQSKAPMRLYHGTTATEGGKGQEAIRRIKPSKEGALGSGVYMTPQAAHASGYSGIPNDEALALMAGDPYAKKMADQFMADRASGTLREGQESGNMLPVYAQIRNPLIIEGKGDPMVEALVKLGMDEESASKMVERAYEQKGYIGKQVENRARAAGYDGLMQYRDGDLSEVVSYNPNAVKSAIGNRGTYNTADPDLSKARGGPIHMQKGGKSGKAGALGKIAQAIQAADKEADAIIQAGKLEEALKAKQAPMTTPQGTGLPLMPRSAGMYTPGVEQKDLARMPMVDKARAAGQSPKYTERMQDLLDSPTARKKVNTLIEKGDELGMREWYGTEPLRQVAMDIGMSQKDFDSFLAQMASASQRNPVDQQNKMGSFLWHLSQSGGLPDDAFLMTNKIRRGKQEAPKGTAIELPPGYGSLAQGDIFSRGKQIAAGDIEGALPETAKLGTFYRNLQGNLKPVTVDVNAVRGPVIERGDPRWLASKLVEKDEEGNVLATHFPRKDVASGKMSLKEAKARPGFWEAAPSGSEYAGFEDLWQRAAKRKGVAPAEAQALGWYGSADVTALKTKPELYIDNLERMIRRTAEQTGQNPRQVMEDVLRGKQYLKKKGGAVHKIKAFSDDETAKRYREEMLGEINKANGGAIKKLAWKQTPAMKMAQGGAPNLGPTTEHTMPDPGDAGRMNYERGYAGGGAAAPEEMLMPPSDDQKGKARLMAEILARMAKDQGKEEIASLRKPRAATDLLNKGMVASTVGAPVDIMNMGLEGVDALRGLASGKPVENRLASDKPFLGSEHLKELMKQYGMVSDEERPMMETALSIASPGAAVKGAVKGAKAIPKAASAVGGGLSAAPALLRR